LYELGYNNEPVKRLDRQKYRHRLAIKIWTEKASLGGRKMNLEVDVDN